MNDNTWPSAADRLNKYVRMDSVLANRLNELSRHEAAADKLALAIAEGRCYGLQQQYYDMILRRQLNREKPHIQGPW